MKAALTAKTDILFEIVLVSEIVFFFSDSQVVTKGLECEEGGSKIAYSAYLLSRSARLRKNLL